MREVGVGRLVRQWVLVLLVDYGDGYLMTSKNKLIAYSVALLYQRLGVVLSRSYVSDLGATVTSGQACP